MTTRLYGIVWRWHFAAGLAACPVLVVLALTGAIYTFQVELERAWKPSLFAVAPGDARLPIEALVARVPASCAPASVVRDPDPAVAVMVWCTVVDGGLARWGVDPYRGGVGGPDDFNRSFFGVVFALHWELLLGERGRLIVEWATSWAVLVMASGAYLWWPRGRRAGTWWPRRLAGRQRLRDLHAVAGAYALPVLLAVAATGLCWTRLAGGDRWSRVANDASEETWEKPPKSAVHGARIGVDRALAAARIEPGDPRAVYVALPQAADDPYVMYAYATDHSSPSAARSTWVDAYSGAVLRTVGWTELSTMGAVSNALYAVHVGSIAGLPGRIGVLLAALVLAGLCATGPWMWWKRRPRGGLGIPPPARRAPWPLYALIAGLGWLLPMVGYTLLVVVALEAIAWLVRRARRAP